jgi:hypothetical protein
MAHCAIFRRGKYATVDNLYDLLARLVTDLCDRDQLGDCPPSLGGTVDHAAARLLHHAAVQPMATPFDDDLPTRLNELDRLPLPDRLRLLQAAVQRTRT